LSTSLVNVPFDRLPELATAPTTLPSVAVIVVTSEPLPEVREPVTFARVAAAWQGAF
jgi:hypothetical protein